MRQRAAWVAALCVALLAGTCLAAALPAVAPPSTGVLGVGVAAPRYALEAGAGATRDRFVDDFALSENRTSFSIRIQAKAGGDMTVKDVFRVASASTQPRVVTLQGEG